MTDADVATLLSRIAALTAVVEEESAILRASPHGAIGELAVAKLRLSNELDAQGAALDRLEPGWMARLPRTSARDLLAALARLAEAARENGEVLARQIAFAQDFVGAIQQEKRRVTGRVVANYGSLGRIAAAGNAPIAIDGSF